jgi:3-dehydroquinate synthase
LEPQSKTLPTTKEKHIHVELGDRSYKIIVSGSEVTNATQAIVRMADQILDVLSDLTHAVILGDEAVASSVSEPLERELSGRKIRVSAAQIPSGETSKSVAELARLWEWMLSAGVDRRSVVIAIGGGVTGDLAGFAAATYARGLRVVQIPTTLLSMVDSSVGGKTGINLPGAKNMVGAFWQPSLVIADSITLNTLPDREYVSGLAEVIKYGVIEDPDFFHWLEVNIQSLICRDSGALREAISRSCESKARVVGDDERETSGRRAILNYGHTFAHAIEATAGYGQLLHGEAVAIGMQMAASLAIALGRADQNLLDRQTRLLVQSNLPIKFPEANVPGMLEIMRRDKKVEYGKLRFVLPTKIGHVELVGNIDESHVVAAIQAHV